MSSTQISNYTTQAILSNWARLAKFIQQNDALEWEQAKEKALKLFKDKEKAVAYIDSKRGNKSKAEQKKSQSTENSENEGKQLNWGIPKKKTKKTKVTQSQDVFSKNYKLLMKVAPGLEERLINNEEVYGVSKVPGQAEIILDWLLTEDESTFHIQLAEYAEAENLITEPDFRLLVDVKNEKVEVLTFTDVKGIDKVYDNIFNRNKVDIKLKDSYNKLLNKWLTNLIRLNHIIEWNPTTKIVNTPHLKVEKGASVKSEKKDSKKETQEKEATKREKVRAIKAIFSKNFKMLERLIPDITTKLKKNEVDGILTNTEDKTFDLVPAEPYNTTTFRFGINDNIDKKSMIISVNVKYKRAWVEYADKGVFIEDKNYSHSENSLLSAETALTNMSLEQWLYRLFSDKYKVKWNGETEEKKHSENKPQEVGKVVLTEYMIKRGIKQKHIDWINQHQRGLLLIPRKNLINNTKNFHADLSHKAMRGGKRISRDGVIYYEGRSNRADITGHGL